MTGCLSVCALVVLAQLGDLSDLSRAYEEARDIARNHQIEGSVHSYNPSQPSYDSSSYATRSTPAIGEVLETRRRSTIARLEVAVAEGVHAYERGEGLDRLEAALELERDSGVAGGNATLLLGWALMQEQKYARAERLLTLYTATHPEDARGWEYLGDVRRARNERSARKAYLNGLKASGSTEAVVALALQWEAEGNRDDALALYDDMSRYCSRKPCDEGFVAAVAFEHAEMLRRAGRHDDAIEILETIREFPTACAQIAIIYADQKKLEKAIEWNREAIRLNRQQSNAWNNLGVDYYAGDAIGPAVVSVRQASRLRPHEELYQKNLDTLYRSAGVSAREVDGWMANASGEKAKVETAMQRIARELSELGDKIPEPDGPVRAREAVLLGLMNDPAHLPTGLVSPLSGKPIGDDAIEALGSKDLPSELLRGIQDNQWSASGYRTLDHMSLDSEKGKALLSKWKGAKFDRLFAHSNGATVAQALIDREWIEVKELNLIGGDRALVNEAALRTLLADGKVKRVVVWVHQGDPIPYASSTPMSVSLKELSVFLGRALTDPYRVADSRVEYRVLKGDCGEGMFGCHDLEKSYFPKMRDAVNP